MFFSVCPEMMYPQLKVESRVARVAEQGFTHIDLWDLRVRDLDELERELKRYGVNLNTFCGHRDTSTSNASDRTGFLKELRASLKLAERFECDKLIVFSDGLLSAVPGTDPPVLPAKPNRIAKGERMANMADALGDAVALAEKSGVTLLLEGLNQRDHPDYFLCNSRLTLEVVKKVGSKRLKMLYDIYHMQRSEGDIIHTLVENLDQIGYIHFADSPGRTEPGTGELNLVNILEQLNRHGYALGLGFEYRPRAPDDETLRRARETVSPYQR